ncbi:hypothetical protein K8Z61_18005 [Nocardioides sp. TRM66260-LWL]|uniref:hypothetical protein n=1 Tax=Nocardioides sp. TRM66260-LWL TaxID=2874478 RepID=UPI001CC43AB4|nr:hypothetical protein [Nocardioides sp. TRM66260-LWL]MBZ5736389.1 hypothetical protein [Nocardioides sp. TRM66260-LWL]
MSSIRRRAKNSAVDKQLSNWTKRRVISWTLFALAGLVAVQHLLAHAGFRPLPISMGWQDLLLGYPMAIVIAVIGGIAMDPNPRI